MNEMRHNWKPITEEFRKSCSELQLGELVKDSNFGLFEAMSAIEMMDPKMDAGLLANQPKSKIKSFEQAIENNLVKTKNFEIDEKLAIIDNTFCNLITWLDGTSLAQTVFTNLYLHNPDLVEDKLIKWFSIAIVKIVDLIRHQIFTASVYEEEDFQSMHYNFKFFYEINEQTCINALKSVEDETAKYYRNIKSQQNENESLKTQVDLASGLLARIKFTRLFYQLLSNINEQNFDEVIKFCNQSKETLKLIENTHELGVKPSFVESGKTNYPVVMGFEPSINQRLLPPTFPRYIRIHSFDSTMKEFNKILDHIPILANLTKTTSFTQIFDFMIKYGDLKPTVLNRSFTQLIRFPKNSYEKLHAMSEFLRDSIKQFIEPPALQTKSILYNKEFCKQLVDSFLNKSSPVFISLIQVLGNNRARQREKMGHLLEDFFALQEEADSLDRILHSYLVQQKAPQTHLACFGSWVLYNSLTIMTHYLFFGFELELYSPYEYHYIYWYLSEILLNWLITTLNRVDSFLLNASESNTNKPSKKSKKKMKSNYDKELSILYAHRHMCSAYYQAMKAFNSQNKIKKPNEEFNDEELRYEHRLLPFQIFNTPPMCHYAQFREKDDQFVSLFSEEQMFKSAQEHFEQAKNCYEELGEWNNSSACAKVAKTNFVIMRLLASGVKKIETINFDFTTHVHFPVIRI